jgi:hypothetical protein
MMRNSQVIEKFPLRQVPHEERERFLCLIAAHENPETQKSESSEALRTAAAAVHSPSITRHQQRVEEPILASFECRDAVARLQIHQINVHSVARQADQMLCVVQSEIRHLLVHDTFQRDLQAAMEINIEIAKLSRGRPCAYLESPLIEVEHANLALAQHSEIEFAHGTHGGWLWDAFECANFRAPVEG